MMMETRVIINGHLIDPKNNIDQKMDIRIVDGKVYEVKEKIEPIEGEWVTDAKGLIVSPGFIDLHCHMREPGQEVDASLADADLAEVAGTRVEFDNRLGHACRIREGDARFGFFRQLQAIAFDVGVGGVEQRQIILVATRQVLGQVRLESRHPAIE